MACLSPLDFRSGSLYSHGLDRSRFDIGQTLETLFQVKPENLDIKDYRVTKTEVDSTRGRAKVLVTVRYRILNRDKKTRENEMILYWMKRHPDCPVGATCNAGQCHDEFGAAIHRKTKEEAEDEAERKNKEAKAEAKREHKDQFETVEPDKEVFACDVTKEEAWFMNLDSTLRGKKYQNADEREKK